MKDYYHNKNKYIFETHRFATEIPLNAKWLVIGTFPTLEKKFQYDFYYSSETNIFWKVIEEIFKPDFKNHKGDQAISERKEFLKKHRIGITDMIECCYRKCNSSLDQDIIPTKLRDIFLLLDKYQTIDTIILTSRTGIISAAGLFKTLFLMNGDELDLVNNSAGICIGEFQRNRKINVLVPYSTSKSFHKDDPLKYRQVKDMYAFSFDKCNC